LSNVRQCPIKTVGFLSLVNRCNYVVITDIILLQRKNTDIIFQQINNGVYEYCESNM
jgi:hypothetical protein